MKTGKVLRAMLTENTGAHMLDSGGAYGRAWQQNKGRDFDAGPAATLTIEEGYIDIRRSTYHFLEECLEFDVAMDQRFFYFNEGKEIAGLWLARMEEFAKSIDATGIYGEGSPLTMNSYIHRSFLDQAIQYVYFEIDEQGYILLQIQVQGDYTAPKAFRCNIDNYPSVFNDTAAEITCKGEDHRWFVEDGDWDVNHYEDDDSRTFNEFPIIASEGIYHKVHEKGKIAEGKAFGVIWQDSTGVHCPLCGEILEVW